jgi:polar amino acid transport system permease protein
MDLLAFGDRGWGDELFYGGLSTLGLAVSALPIGLFMGLLLALAKSSREVTYRIAGNALTSVFRGLPELLTILLVYILGQRALNHMGVWLGYSSGIDISMFWSGVAALSIVFAAYASEVFLGSLRAMEGSSLEAAKALGLGPWVTLRFITLPELFRLSRPGLLNLWLSLLKQTSLVSVIAYGELLHQGYVAASSSGEQIFFYAIVCAIYILLCTGTGRIFYGLIGLISSDVKRRA